jgi:imidazolonepropionase-like amidohydrolase
MGWGWRAALLLVLSCRIGPVVSAQRINVAGAEVRKYVRVATRRTILTHVRVVDGTGGPPLDDRNVTIDDGVIVSISDGADVPSTRATTLEETTVIALPGFSVLPGIVGMHDHLVALTRPNLRDDNSADAPGLFLHMAFSAPRLYLANGVTTIRTTGSSAPYADVRLAQEIEAGEIPGPHMDVTGPYLEGASGNLTPQFPHLAGPDDARETVAFWANRGVTSFKAYAHITRDELRAAITEAHARGLKVTGHLCSVTYPEAIALGIDNLEHGFMANTQNDPDKRPDTCSASSGDYTLDHMEPRSPDAIELIASLVSHHVAITSTLPGLAAGIPTIGNMADGTPLRQAALDAMSPTLRHAYQIWYDHPSATRAQSALRLRREMDLEREFVDAGGLLLAGPDPVGVGGLVPGFADHREIELLVEAGFTPPEGIRIATLNGAIFLGRDQRIGSVAVGKSADLLVVKGNPAARIGDIENVEIVFKDGVGYDVGKLLASVKGRYGEY